MNSKRNVFGNVTERTWIYRFFPRDRFFQLFEESQNALVRPTMWDDPFENAILDAAVRAKAGENGECGYHEVVYGQSWTLAYASDAMWQIYSPNKDAIRVRTTVGKLLQSIRAESEDWTDAACFIGRVKYLKKSELREFCKTVFSAGLSKKAVARSLLVKRKAHKHENEVRLIFFELTNTKHPGGVYKYGLDPLALIDQVMVDGRVSREEYLRVKAKIMRRTILKEQQVERSLLYQEPKNIDVKIP